MIRALLIVWHLDPSGAGSVAGIDFESLSECYQFSGRANMTARHACVAEGDAFTEAAATLARYRCDVTLISAGFTAVCAGVTP